MLVIELQSETCSGLLVKRTNKVIGIESIVFMAYN